jgi:hypothetical protein
MLLADDFGQSVRPQALGQGLMGNGWGMGVDVRDHDPSSIQRSGQLRIQMGWGCLHTEGRQYLSTLTPASLSEFFIRENSVLTD